MPAAALDELYDYDQQYLADILKSVKTIAMVGASADKTKFSYGVLRVLHETGYDMIPVNPNPNLTEIRGIPVYHSLEEIDRPVDMVEVFRPKDELYGITEQAIAIGAKVLWGQIDVYDDGTLWQGDFWTDRALARAALSGTHDYGGLVLRPQLDLAWMEERQSSYTVSDADSTVSVAGITTSTGRLSFSSEIEWPLNMFGGNVNAVVIPAFAWDFAGSGDIAGHRASSGSLDLGLRTSHVASWNAEASIRLDGLGDPDFRGVTLRLAADRQF
jgi:predicted CoA-binding protein